jgi:peptide/nickel transport system permease protein
VRKLLSPVGFGALLLAGLIGLALFAPWLAPHDPSEIRLEAKLTGPGPSHPFGTDPLGRDVLSRVIYGARVSVLVGSMTVAICFGLGTLIGCVAGYYGGWPDEIIMRTVDIVLAFPGILLAITLTAVLGPSLRNVVLALTVMGWVGYARIARAQVLALRESDFVLAARALGVRDSRLIARHLFPNILAPLIVEATFGMAGAILAEAGLSFLGLGTQPPTPSWGNMLNEGRQFLFVSPHMTLAPGMAIMIVVLGLNLLGDALRDRFDVKGGGAIDNASGC